MTLAVMQAPSRIVLSMAGGILLTVLVFWVMQWMISRESPQLVTDGKAPVMEFVRLVRDSETQLKQRKKPEPPEEPPPPEVPDLSIDIPSQAIMSPNISMPAPSMPLDFAGPVIGPVLSGMVDRNFMAIARTPPQYPYNAARKGVEGWVKVSLLITETGSVKDVVVIDSSPPGIFDLAATRAVYKWKFKPRIVEGKPVSTRAEQTVEFTLKK